eukprot:3471401-Amphidinium_carterae.1
MSTSSTTGAARTVYFNSTWSSSKTAATHTDTHLSCWHLTEEKQAQSLTVLSLDAEEDLEDMVVTLNEDELKQTFKTHVQGKVEVRQSAHR